MSEITHDLNPFIHEYISLLSVKIHEQIHKKGIKKSLPQENVHRVFIYTMGLCYKAGVDNFFSALGTHLWLNLSKLYEIWTKMLKAYGSKQNFHDILYLILFNRGRTLGIFRMLVDNNIIIPFCNDVSA